MLIIHGIIRLSIYAQDVSNIHLRTNMHLITRKYRITFCGDTELSNLLLKVYLSSLHP